MLYSMTGFASAKGAELGYSWSWELRSVNGKGLDLRLRLPDWIEGLETDLRTRLGKALTRGNVNLTLRLQSDTQQGALTVNEAQLQSVLEMMSHVTVRACDEGVTLAPATPSDILSVRGVVETSVLDTDNEPLRAALREDFETLLKAFLDMRATEGAALEAVVLAQIDQIADLGKRAKDLSGDRDAHMKTTMRSALSRILENSEGADEGRIAQELALITVKADITEELDRIDAHVQAARDLVSTGSPVGRKLDFLTQEFNREANTLCSKAQFSPLTVIGLELKTVIDQMREQVQNVE